MIMSSNVFEIYQYFAYGWFCIGVLVVGFLSIRDLIHIICSKNKDNKENK